MSYLRVVFIFSSGGHFVQWSGTVRQPWSKIPPRNIPVKLFLNPFTGLGVDVFQVNC